jgi:HAE1 family hydrophobic/amphiphilic exporter-1
VVSQYLTLYTTPVVYLYLDRLNKWLSGERAKAPSRVQALLVTKAI